MNEVIQNMNRACKEYEFKVNANKAKTMEIGTKVKSERIKIHVGNKIQKAQGFKYIGIWLSEDMKCGPEIKARNAFLKEVFNKKKEALKAKKRAKEKIGNVLDGI